MEILYSLLFLFFCSIIVGQDYKQEYGKPKIVLIEYDPWAMAIGADTPTFVLYDSGIVIYKDFEHKVNLVIKLTSEEKDNLLKSFNITDQLLNLPENIDVSNWTDQPTNTLSIIGDSVKTINVYGSIRDDGEARNETPESFLNIFDKIICFKNKNAEKWLPNKIEVMVWDYSHSRGKSLNWPNEWPDLNDESTIDRGGMYSIYIDKKHYNELIDFLGQLKDRQSININGNKFTVSLRFPFPGI